MPGRLEFTIQGNMVLKYIRYHYFFGKKRMEPFCRSEQTFWEVRKKLSLLSSVAAKGESLPLTKTNLAPGLLRPGLRPMGSGEIISGGQQGSQFLGESFQGEGLGHKAHAFRQACFFGVSYTAAQNDFDPGVQSPEAFQGLQAI